MAPKNRSWTFILRPAAATVRSCLPFFVAAVVAVPSPSQAALRCEAVFRPETSLDQARARIEPLITLQQRLAGTMQTLKRRNDPSLGALARLYNGPLRFLLPVPLPRAHSEAGLVFEKIWKNPAAELTPAEHAALKLANALPLAERQRALLQKNPAYRQGRLMLDRLQLLTSLLILSLAAHQTVESADQAYDFDEYVNLPDFDGDRPVMHLLIETVPFPHTALRIGAQVYSYGQTHMTSRSVAEYLATPPEPAPASPGARAFIEKWSARLRDTGALDRSVRFVELNLPLGQALALRRELEMNTGKRYNNITMVNDCATMIARALEKNSGLKTPPLLDAFPSTAGLYLTARRLLGDARIGRTGLVLTKKAHLNKHLARNFWLAKLEAAAFLATAAYSVPERARIDTADSALQWWDPETLEEIESWRIETRRVLRESYGIDDLIETRKRAAPALYARMIDTLFTRERKEAVEVLRSPRAEFHDLIVAQTKIEEIDRLLAELAPTK